MISSFPYARYASLLAVLCVMPQTRAQDAPPPTQTAAPSATSKKIWTNENISSTRGGIAPVVDSDSGASSANTRDFESSSHGATFVNPKPGQLVYPGEILRVDLAIDPGVTLAKGAAINSPFGFSDQIREAPPYSFIIKVPDKDEPGNADRLIGLQPLYALGAVAGRPNDLDLATTTIDVEEPGLPLSLFAAGGMMSNHGSSLSFFGVGGDESVAIYAKFPNGHELDVSHSAYLQLTSSNPAIVRVADEGSVISVGVGYANVIATYTLGGQQKRLLIPVSIERGPEVLAASPAAVDFGDIPVGTTSPSRQVTITNSSSNDVKIYDVHLTMGPENCSNTTLAPGGSCTLTVNLYVNRPGPAHLIILIDTSVAIALLGNGV